MGELFKAFWESTGIAGFFTSFGWQNLVMIVLACVLLFLAIVKKFEPYLLLPISFGMLLVNLPGAMQEFFKGGTAYTVNQYVSMLKDAGIENTESVIKAIFASLVGEGKTLSGTETFNTITVYRAAQGNIAGMTDAIKSGLQTIYNNDLVGLLGHLYYGVKWGIYPCLIFLCIGATTDFGPLIANKKTMLLGAAAQIGIFVTFIGAIGLGKLFPALNFGPKEASAIGIIGGADGPTAILVTSKLAPELLGSISIAAYSYMALVPVIQPPIMRLLTTKKERLVKMDQVRDVSKTEKILFPITVTIITVLFVPSAAPLIGCLMLGNLIKESGVVPKITETLANSLMYIITIILGLCVGATAVGETFLSASTLGIFALGIFAFAIATASGVLFGKLMCKVSHGKINPLIGAAGVSAVPMAARVAQKEGAKEDPTNFLLMHAMGPNVAGVIGSAVAAGMLLLFFA